MERRVKGNNNPTASSAPPPPWIELPTDVTANILRRLAPEAILGWVESVCTTWRSVCLDPSFWRVLDMNGLYIHSKSDRLCRRSVDRSQGQLIEINIRNFGNTDVLLQYISERSTNLKILSLDSCESISPDGWTAAVKKLSRLEELHIFFAPVISELDMETIGLSCPMLNSFTYNTIEIEFGDMDNSQALSIAKNMPNLKRLRLVGNPLSNEGLLAILDGCPNLELLDLLHCYDIDLECDLGRRCSEQVKMLRGTVDYISYCEWDARIYDLEEDWDFLLGIDQW